LPQVGTHTQAVLLVQALPQLSTPVPPPQAPVQEPSGTQEVQAGPLHAFPQLSVPEFPQVALHVTVVTVPPHVPQASLTLPEPQTPSQPTTFVLLQVLSQPDVA
jgi:hypothetical protein